MEAFLNRLRRLRKVWQQGLTLAAIYEVAGWLLVALLVYGLLDVFLAFDERVRTVAGVTLLGLAAAWLILRLVRAWSLTDADMARRADAILENRRQPALTALELGREAAAGTEFERYLVEESVREAGTQLEGMSLLSAFPNQQVRRDLRRFALQALLVAGIAGAFWAVACVVVPRLAMPWRDLPPYSPYQFAIEPSVPKVIYGQNAEVAVEISGAPVKSQVWFLTRNPSSGEIFRTACFQEGPSRFAQRLEKVTQPLEFAFAAGKGRSKWQPIELLLQPKIALASVTLNPPEYANLPERSFIAGAEALEGLRGTELQLAVTSNRPLSGGKLLVRDANNPTEERAIEATQSGPHSLSFAWKLDREADLEIEIWDVRGVRNDEPFQIRQQLVPDTPPEVEMANPPAFVLATPGIQVPISGKASDDLGLSRVELVRNVVGYRDRMKNLVPETQRRSFGYREDLDLASLGVAPGDVLELYLEASDTNPSLLGMAASEVARVQVISEEDYAAMIRARTTVDGFLERYYVVQEKLRDLQQRLEALREDPGNAEKRAQAKAAANDAAGFLKKLAKDFAVYDLEKQLIEQSRQTGEDVAKIAERLGEEFESEAQLREEIADMLEALGLSRDEFEQQVGQAEDAASIGRVMEAAARFSQVLREQIAFERRLRKFQENGGGRANQLQALGRVQQKIREKLGEFEEYLSEALEGLPAAQDELKQAGSAFLQALRRTRAANDMERSAQDANNQNGPSAHQFTQLALEKLESLVSGEGNSEDVAKFGSLCQGRNEFGMPPGLKQTLEQLLMGIAGRAGNRGRGQPGNKPGMSRSGGGIGAGGDLDSGYAMSGYSQLNVPVLGPDRMELNPRANSARGGQGSGGGGNRAQTAAQQTDRINPENQQTTRTESLGQMELVPGKYRDAVKRYFSSFDDSDR